MAKVNKKVAKAAESDTKLAKVNTKSVTIQKADKKGKENQVKNLKAKVDKTAAKPQKAKNNSPKKVAKASPKKANKAGPKKDKKLNLQKKTSTTGGASIVPKKNAKKLQKATNKPTKDLVSKEDIAKSLTSFKAGILSGLAERKAMLDPDFKYILQLCCFKIPQCPERIARTQLAHSLYNDTDDVCLFVKDIEAGHKRDYQPTIDYFREKLDAVGITNIKAIMPMSQLVKDYKQSEMVRKLANTYDCFLADSRIAPHLAKMLGKTFAVQKKSPIPVRMNHKLLKEHLERATAKVQYHQTNSGDSIAIAIGKHCMDEAKIVDNIHQTFQNMHSEFHGGWANLKRAYLRPAMNLSKSSVLVYANSDSGADVPIPVVVGPRAKALAEKQKKLNKLLPEGMMVTSKGELAIVESRKRPASAEDDKKAKKPKKDNKSEKKSKKEAVVGAKSSATEAKKNKNKKAKEEVVKEEAAPAPAKVKKVKGAQTLVEEVTPAAEPETKGKGKKEPKQKKVAEVETPEPVVVKKKDKKKQTEAVVEETPVVAAKKTKKEKNVPAEVAAPAKPNKKEKKSKSTSDDVADADLSKEVSDLWEQIKNESAAELGELAPKKGKNKRKAVEEGSSNKNKKQQKK